jgi:hypothetical protein
MELFELITHPVQDNADIDAFLTSNKGNYKLVNFAAKEPEELLEMSGEERRTYWKDLFYHIDSLNGVQGSMDIRGGKIIFEEARSNHPRF